MRLNSLAATAARRAQRGAVLLLTLIVLVVLLIGAIALVRSFDTALLTAGSISFKRDLINEGELVVPRVLAAFNAANPAAPLGTAALRQNDVLAQNYSASLLPSDVQDIPAVLTNGRGFGSAGAIVGTTGVSVNYVIERMCDVAGLEEVLGPGRCVMTQSAVPKAGTTITSNGRADQNSVTGERGAVPQQVVYRITMRVDGPRRTQAFLQTTFAQ